MRMLFSALIYALLGISSSHSALASDLPEAVFSRLTAEMDAASGPVGCTNLLGRSKDPGCKTVLAALKLSKTALSISVPKTITAFSMKISKISDREGYLYFPVLFAALTEDDRFIPALEKLSKVEMDLKLSLPYAHRALERIRTGRCTDETKISVNEREICGYKDPIIRRLLALDRAAQSGEGHE